MRAFAARYRIEPSVAGRTQVRYHACGRAALKFIDFIDLCASAQTLARGYW
jgi:hypothetical protein